MNIYGLLIGIGIVIGIELVTRQNRNISYKDILFLLISTLIGARLLFVLHNLKEITEGNITPYAIWDGGVAFYGGIIGLFIGIWIVSRYKKSKFFVLSDSILLFLPLVHSIGRIGNFFNYELYGKPTNLPWAIYIPQEYRLTNYTQYSYFHPVFIYESILNIFNFSLLYVVSKKTKSKGIITALYLVNYSIIRLLLNTLRIDKEYLFNIETSNLLSLFFLVTGIIILITHMKNKSKLAKFFSQSLMFLLSLFASFTVLLHIEINPIYQILLILFTFILPILSILLFKLLDLTSDLTISKREERPKLFLTFLAFFLISLGISIYLKNPILIEIYSVLNLTFVLGTLITYFWKISFHMIVSTLFIFFICYLLKVPQLYSLFILLPLIGWSRLQLRKHSFKQVLGGTLLSIFCILVVLSFSVF